MSDLPDPGASEHHRRNRIIGRLGDHKILAALERILVTRDCAVDPNDFGDALDDAEKMLEEAACE